jgi:hypothetical protein
VKTLITLSLSAVCALMMCGCWNGRVLLAFEQPFWTSLGDDLPERLALARECLPRGYLPRLLLTPPPEDPAARLARELASGRYRAAVVSPLLSSQWRGFAAQFAQTRFILIGEGSPPDLPSNVTLVRYDRTDAFRAAGFAAGLSVREEGGGAGDASLAGRVGMILASVGVLTGEETDAFASGVAEALDGGRPSVRTLANATDKVAAKSAIEQMRQAGVEILLLGMGSLDPWCLEIMASAGGSAVVADWAVSGAFPRQVFLSIEEDVPRGIGRALAALSSNTAHVRGPVRLFVGSARPVPVGAKSRVEAE